MSGVPLLDGKITRNEDTDFVPSGNYNQYLVADPSQVFCPPAQYPYLIRFD